MANSRPEHKNTHSKISHTYTTNNLISLAAGPGIAALAEIAIFHPLDTVSKRLQNNTNKTASGKVIFGNAYQGSALKKIDSLYNGVLPATGYKLSQRIYKFGGQPLVKSILDNSVGDDFKAAHKVILNGFAGSIIGIGEVALLPLDIWKIRKQNNRAMQWDSTIYRGATTTMARNAIGSFALFGGSALTKEMLGVENHNDAKLWQEFAGAAFGAFGSVVATSPLDVVKTRLQTDGGNATSIVKGILKNEGLSAFSKGLVPKVIAITPKVAFSMAISNYLIKKCNETLKNHGLFATPELPKQAASESIMKPKNP